jgi:short-subunit dehydrogenase
VPLPAPSPDATALVTGASSGIGAEIARELAKRGHGVTLVARREERLRDLAAELSEGHGVRAEVIGADLVHPAGRDALAARVEELGLHVAALVNNAGFGGGGKLARADREYLVRMVQLNCEAVVDLQARYLPEMIERGSGAVINVASTAAFQPLPGSTVYGATKAFVLSLSEAAHAELKGTGVSVTALCPGPVKTEFIQVARIDEAAADSLPDVFWTPVETVAREAVDGAEKGKRVVVPGILNRAGSITGQHTPRAVALPIVKRIWSRAS